MFRLDGKIAIVTGGARGIGAASAKALCEAGASVVITDILEDRAEQTATALAAEGHQLLAVRHDVRDPASWAVVVERTLARFGRIDCLVNNAGIMIPRTIENATAEEFRAAFEVNVMGNFFGLQAVIPVMKETGGGTIINIASDVTSNVMPLATIYAPTKSAQASLSKCAAVHCAESNYGIRINTIHPGSQETDMLIGDNEHAQSPEVREYIANYVNKIPMRRMGKPVEVGAIVVFLAADEPAYMTGSEIFIDGGISIT